MEINYLFHKIYSLLSLKCSSVSFSKSDNRCNRFKSALTVGGGWYFFYFDQVSHPYKTTENCSSV